MHQSRAEIVSKSSSISKKREIKSEMKIYYTCVLLMTLASVGLAAEIGDLMCGVHYQDAVMEVITIKKTCDKATFYDCCQVKNLVSTSQTGLYEISSTESEGPFSSSKIFARCDMETDNGGWTIIQRRVAGGTVDFYRNWDDYEAGFGDLEGEFWLGLQNIHRLTTRDEVELRIDLQDEQGNERTWTYQEFRVDGPTDNYRLHIGGGEGPPGVNDAMVHHNNRQFSTYDRDNDDSATDCAEIHQGGWWYGDCINSNLNGLHALKSRQDVRVVWYTGPFIYYPNVEMKVRPKHCREDC